MSLHYNVLFSITHSDQELIIKNIIKGLPIKADFNRDIFQYFSANIEYFYNIIFIDTSNSDIFYADILRKIKLIEVKRGTPFSPIVFICNKNIEREIPKDGPNYYFLKTPISHKLLIKYIVDYSDLSIGQDSKLEPAIQKLRPNFIKNRLQDIESINNSIIKKNFAEIERVSHSIKGVSEMYGFPNLKSIVIDLEAAAQNHDLKNCYKLSRLLEKELNKSI